MVGTTWKIKKSESWRKFFRCSGIWADLYSLQFTQLYKWVHESEGGESVRWRGEDICSRADTYTKIWGTKKQAEQWDWRMENCSVWGKDNGEGRQQASSL